MDLEIEKMNVKLLHVKNRSGYDLNVSWKYEEKTGALTITVRPFGQEVESTKDTT